MSTNKTLQGELQHDDEAAALPSPPEAHPVGAPTEPLRQADEPPSEATQSPNLFMYLPLLDLPYES